MLNINREFYSVLLFYNNGIREHMPNNSWSVHAGADGHQIVYNRYPSRFNDLMKINNQTMSILDASCYLLNPRTINIATGCYSLAFWVKLSEASLEQFFIDSYRYIPAVEWDDANGHTVKLNIASHSKDNDNLALTLDISGYKVFDTFYDYVPNHWFHILYSREGNIDRIFVDGKKRFETHMDLTKANKNIFRNIKLGNPYNSAQSGIYQYDFDGFSLCNDILHRDDFKLPDRHIFWYHPEVSHIEVDDNGPVVEPLYGAPGFYNADKTKWDVVLDDIPITRPVYWEEPNNAKIVMVNKHNFSEVYCSHSNFPYIDKNGLDRKY